MNTAFMKGARFTRGFTFVELVISLVVIGLAVAGVLLVFTTTVASSADPMVREQALAIAEGYLDEVVSRAYLDPDGVDTEANRWDFDDIGDYDGLAETPRRSDGTAYGTALNNYLVEVTVAAPIVFSGVNVRRIQVDVTHPSGIDVSLWAYRAQY